MLTEKEVQKQAQWEKVGLQLTGRQLLQKQALTTCQVTISKINIHSTFF